MKPLFDTELGYTEDARIIKHDFDSIIQDFIDTKHLTSYNPIEVKFLMLDVIEDIIIELWMEKSSELYMESGKSLN